MAAQGVPEPSPAKQPSDYRNGDLVSRLLAATPPYLYNMPLLPNSFFFSEMLRSFVQAKSASSAASTGQGHQPTTPGRRGRKRTWKDTTKMNLTMNLSENRELNEKPLELTTSSRTSPPPPPPVERSPPPSSSLLIPPPNPEQFTNTQVPPPPLWYPPSMYHQPPYTTAAPFDPLHFFIDLRVSGHIWDQTKNNREQDPSNRSVEPLDLQTDQKMGLNLKTQSTTSSNNVPTLTSSTPEPLSLFKPSRKHISAFAVPRPRDIIGGAYDASKLHRHVEGETNVVSTNYVLQNLSKIYKEVQTSKSKLDKSDEEVKDLDVKDDQQKTSEDQNAAEKEKKCSKDLRALIGLELVKDYVSFEGKRYPKGFVPDANVSDKSVTENTFKKEATEEVNDEISDDGSHIQVDDDDDEIVDDDDSSNNYENDVSRRLMNDARNDQYIDYSRTRLRE